MYLPFSLYNIFMYTELTEETEQLIYMKDKYGICELAIKRLDKYFDFDKTKLYYLKDFNLISVKYYQFSLVPLSLQISFHLKNFNIKNNLVNYFPNIKIKCKKIGLNNDEFETDLFNLKQTIKAYTNNENCIISFCEYIFFIFWIKYIYNKYIKKNYQPFIIKSIQKVGL